MSNLRKNDLKISPQMIFFRCCSTNNHITLQGLYIAAKSVTKLYTAMNQGSLIVGKG